MEAFLQTKFTTYTHTKNGMKRVHRIAPEVS
jgi:hypothetical protein